MKNSDTTLPYPVDISGTIVGESADCLFYLGLCLVKIRTMSAGQSIIRLKKSQVLNMICLNPILLDFYHFMLDIGRDNDAI